MPQPVQRPLFPGLAIACGVLAAAAPAGAQPNRPPPRTNPPPIATAHAADLDEVVRAAHALPRGGRLLLEGLPLGAGGPQVSVTLRRVQVFTDDAEVHVHHAAGEDRTPPPATSWMQGELLDGSGSLALLTVPEHGPPHGLLWRQGGLFLIRAEGPDVSRGRGRLMARHGDTGKAGPPFDCRLPEIADHPGLVETRPRNVDPDDPLPGGLPGHFVADATAAGGHTARIAVETDWELFQRFGNRTAATEYVGDLFAYLSALYQREVDTSLEVSYLSLWDSSADPWAQTSPSCGLYEFGRYWNRNRSFVERTTAHFPSGKSTSAGIAWIGVLCSGGFTVDHGGSCPGLTPQRDEYGGAYGYTGGIRGSFDPAAPTLVWDVLGVAHEIGHNFDSPHTHCYGGIGGVAQPVDQCSANECGQPGCFCGTPSLPCSSPGAGCGTVMSYCHLLSGGLGNISFTFGQNHPYGVQPGRVPERMRAHVAERAAADPSCLAPATSPPPCDDLFLSALTVTTTTAYSTCGTLSAGDGFRVGKGGDVTFAAGRIVLRNGFSVANGGSLTAATTP